MTSHVPLAAQVRRAQRNGIGDLLWRSAERFPDTTAIVYRNIRQSYAQLDETVNRMANALTERGIRKGDRIALLSHNNHGFVVVFFAAARIGAILVPINFMLNATEVAYILGHAKPVAMVVEDGLLPVAESALHIAEVDVLTCGVILEASATPPGGWQSVADWMLHADARAPDIDIDDDDPVNILYTSGTESRPKGATLSSRNFITQYLSQMLSSRNFITQYLSQIVDGEMSTQDVEVHALPLFHCAQLHVFLVPDIYIGATSIVLPGADPAAILAAVEAERATKLFCPPTVWIALLRHPDFDRRDLSSLRKGYYGASIMPVEVIKELAGRLPRMRLFNLYGQTEMSPLATVLKPEDQMRKLGSAGRASLNVETRVVDDDDRPVPAGMMGEIVHRSPHAMLGYWNDPEKTAEAFRNGWFHSGDLGVMDEEGYLYVVDRKKDMIKTGGENVASREVEEVLYQHPAIAEVAVFGTPHPQWIEAVSAAAVLRAGQTLDADTLIAFCRERLAGFKVPKRVIFVDKLPKNASGKILKRELRASIAQS